MESALRKLQQHLTESRRIYSQSVSLRRSIYLFAFESIIILAAFASFLYLGDETGLALEITLWALSTIIAFCAFTFMNLPLLRDGDGNLPEGLQTANKLTAVRIFLVPVVFILLVRGWSFLGVILYLIAVLTDVVDGYLARKLHQGSLIGIMLDPVGDIMLTLALFLFLYIEGMVPFWLFVLLAIRYLHFFLGLAVLALLDAVPRLKATRAGKVVGVIQALGILTLLVGTLFRLPVSGWMLMTGIHIILGAAFSSVIASQTIIGLRALQKKA